MGRRRLYESDSDRQLAYRNRKRNTRMAIPSSLVAGAGPLRAIAHQFGPVAVALALSACDLVRAELLDWESLRYAGYVPPERCKHQCQGL